MNWLWQTMSETQTLSLLQRRYTQNVAGTVHQDHLLLLKQKEILECEEGLVVGDGTLFMLCGVYTTASVLHNRPCCFISLLAWSVQWYTGCLDSCTAFKLYIYFLKSLPHPPFTINQSLWRDFYQTKRKTIMLKPFFSMPLWQTRVGNGIGLRPLQVNSSSCPSRSLGLWHLDIYIFLNFTCIVNLSHSLFSYCPLLFFPWDVAFSKFFLKICFLFVITMASHCPLVGLSGSSSFAGRFGQDTRFSPFPRGKDDGF